MHHSLIPSLLPTPRVPIYSHICIPLSRCSLPRYPIPFYLLEVQICQSVAQRNSICGTWSYLVSHRVSRKHLIDRFGSRCSPLLLLQRKRSKDGIWGQIFSETAHVKRPWELNFQAGSLFFFVVISSGRMRSHIKVLRCKFINRNKT